MRALTPFVLGHLAQTPKTCTGKKNWYFIAFMIHETFFYLLIGLSEAIHVPHYLKKAQIELMPCPQGRSIYLYRQAALTAYSN